MESWNRREENTITHLGMCHIALSHTLYKTGKQLENAHTVANQKQFNMYSLSVMKTK